MTELENMETELKELQGKIKRLKEEQNPHFNMSVIDDSISTDYRVSAEPMKNGFRTILKYMTTLTVKTSLRDQYIGTALTIPKMSEIGNEKIRICNDFLLEIQPIIQKYTHLFLEMNSEEGRLC